MRLLTLSLVLLAAPALAAPSVRLLQSGKDTARFEVRLDEPAAVEIVAGEIPGEWSERAAADTPATEHVIDLTGLAPTRRYFYQLLIDGQPASDMLVFTSGRSWVTREATLLVTAAVPGDDPADVRLADALFAQEADALILLGGPGTGEALRRVHARAMTDRVVAAVGEEGAPSSLRAADVAAAWGPGASAELTAATDACWRVATAGVEGADVIVRAAEASSVTAGSEQVNIALAGRAWAHLRFSEGTLTATVHLEDGSTNVATLARTCVSPLRARAAAEPVAHDAADGDAAESTSMDGEADSADCDLP